MLAAVLLGGSPFGLCAASLLVASAVLTAQPATDEPPPTVTASKVLTAAQLKGVHHQVADAVSDARLLPRVHGHVGIRDLQGGRDGGNSIA